MDAKTMEQLWKDPDWECPHCKFMNRAIRDKCRNCAYVGGEFILADVRFAAAAELAKGE